MWEKDEATWVHLTIDLGISSLLCRPVGQQYAGHDLFYTLKASPLICRLATYVPGRRSG